MARLTIGLFGSFQVEIDGVLITRFESNKVRGLLAYLVVESSTAHRREKLTELFWPNMTPNRANSNLSSALYNLRRQIQDHEAQPGYLLRSRDLVQFNPESDYWLDVDSFKKQLDLNRIKDFSLLKTSQDYLERMQAAVNLYRGDFLEGLAFDSSLAFDEWVLLVRQRFQSQVLEGLNLLAMFYAEQDELPRALSFTWRQVELDPLDERASRQLMQLLVANGQRSQALTQFEHLQVMLADELKVAPEPETIALRDRIRGEHRSLAGLKTTGDNFPAFLTPLIGRQVELAEIQAQYERPDCRLLTILGPGGSGKTRLALEAAQSYLKNFQNGIFFIPLNPVQSPASILPIIVEKLELPRGEQGDPQSQLVNYLRNKNLLLVFDGFEHLLEAAGWIAEILHSAPQLKILVTSRTRLNIKGEQVYFLGGMQYPEEENSENEIKHSDAMQLLVAGLRRTRPDYDPAPEDIRYLHQICKQVLGMPLGILLAASWGAALSIKEIAQMASQSLDFLVADWVDAPARQRSLRATFDYTWSLLSEREQAIFQSLSVFRGAFTRQAARMVSEATPHELRTLLDRSLLGSKTPGWYEMHELLRQYGREKLALFAQVEQDVGNRHCEYYLGQLAAFGEVLKTAQQASALGSIELEHENFHAAWNWAASRGAAAQLDQGLDGLCLYYDLSLRYSDGENICRAAIDGMPQESVHIETRALQARIFTWQSRFTRLLGRSKEASQLMERAQFQSGFTCNSGDQASNNEAFIHLEHGNIHFYKDRAAAAVCYQNSLEIYYRLEDQWGMAKALSRLGLLAHHAGSFEDAVQRYSECLELYRSLGDPRGIANALVELGHNTLRQGDVISGQNYIEEGTIILQKIGNRAGVARGNLEIGRSCFWVGQFAKGNSSMAKSIPILEDLGMQDKLVFCTLGLSLGLSHLGNYKDAFTQVMKGLPLAKEIDARREIAMAYLFLGKAFLGQGNYKQTQAWTLKSITQYKEIDQRDELAWALVLMVFVQREMGRIESAKSYLYQTLEIGIETRGYFPVLCGLCGAALLLLDRGEIERAVELASLVWLYPVAANSRWFEDIAGRKITTVAAALPPEIVAAAQERGQARDIWETATELLSEFRCA